MAFWLSANWPPNCATTSARGPQISACGSVSVIAVVGWATTANAVSAISPNPACAKFFIFSLLPYGSSPRLAFHRGLTILIGRRSQEDTNQECSHVREGRSRHSRIWIEAHNSPQHGEIALPSYGQPDVICRIAHQDGALNTQIKPS